MLKKDYSIMAHPRTTSFATFSGFAQS